MTFKDIADKHFKLRYEINDHTRWNNMHTYTAAEVEKLLTVSIEAQAILRELSGITDWQAPFRISEVRERATQWLKGVA